MKKRIVIFTDMKKEIPSWGHEAAKVAAANGRYGVINVNRSVYQSNCEIVFT